MSKLLMESLKLDLPALADLIRSKGRGKDTILAHITPKEAALLKRRGGSGTTNPDTGLPEFQEDFSYDVEAQPGGFYGEAAPAPVAAPEAPVAQPLPTATAAPSTDAEAQLGGFYGGGGALPASAPAPSTDVEAQAGGFYGGRAPTAAEFAATQPGVVSPPAQEEKSWYEKLGLQPKDLTRLGLGATVAGGLTARNIAATRQASRQAEQARGEISALGAPYKTRGEQITSQAERGELTPVSRQALEAARAQVQQGIATRGGVGAQQAANQLSNLTSLLLENQYNFGLKVSQIGDSYALGAIKSGMEADRYLNQANNQFYGQLASLLAPFITGAPSATTPTRT